MKHRIRPAQGVQHSTTPESTSRPGTAQLHAFPSQADEALRRVRARSPKPTAATANGLRMAQRAHSRALSDAIQQLIVAALPHIDNDLTAPMVQLQVHTPAGELVASYDLPKQIADTVTLAVRSAAGAIADDNAEHSRTADTVPARPALSVLTGGVA